MRRSRTGDWSLVIGPGPTVHFFYIFSFSSLVRVVANLRRCLHYHIIKYYCYHLYNYCYMLYCVIEVCAVVGTYIYRYHAPDLPSLPVYPVDYRFLTPSTGLPDGRTFLPVFHNIVQIFFSVVLSITFVRS